MVSSITNQLYDSAIKKLEKENNEAKEFKFYVENKKNEESLENNDFEKDDDEFESVCSVKTYDLSSDDEDDDLEIAEILKSVEITDNDGDGDCDENENKITGEESSENKITGEESFY